MSNNIFYLIERPNNEPLSIEDYRRQNNLMMKIPLLSLGFDGIKLGNWNDGNRALPYIIRGSIFEYLGELYESRSDISLVDNFVNTNIEHRYIKFSKVGDNLKVELTTSAFPNYNATLRGFYNSNSEKFLRVSFKLDRGSYVSKNYWDKEDINRYGSNLKRHLLRFDIGRHEVNFPLEVESITVNISAGGGGGSAYTFRAGGQGRDATDGNLSEIKIEGHVITKCAGGQKAKTASGTGTHGVGGYRGYGSGVGIFYQGKNGTNGTTSDHGYGGKSETTGGNGGDGLDNGGSLPNGGGGGSGGGALVTITRQMLGASKKIIIVVGSAGLGGRKYDGNSAADGEHGVAFLEYFTRSQS